MCKNQKNNLKKKILYVTRHLIKYAVRISLWSGVFDLPLTSQPQPTASLCPLLSSPFPSSFSIPRCR